METENKEPSEREKRGKCITEQIFIASEEKRPPSDLRAVWIPPHVSETRGSESCRLGRIHSSAASLQSLSRTDALCLNRRLSLG
ncbi:hypothetical protein R3I94_017535 [Phoxinus phoxinus]